MGRGCPYDGDGERKEVPQQNENAVDEQFFDHISICQFRLAPRNRKMLPYANVQYILPTFILPTLSLGETSLLIHVRV